MIKKLKGSLPFHEIDEKVLKPLIDTKQIYIKNYCKGGTVHEQNDECSAMDIVYSGKLIAYTLAPNGAESVFFEFKAGNFIGANLLFGNENKYPMSIFCTAESELLHISKAAVMEMLHNYSFVLQFVKSLSMNAQGMNQKIAIYTQKDLRHNIIDYLMALSAQQQAKTLLLPITKKQLANYFGVQRPSLFRELKRMKEEGLIEIDNKIITIKTDMRDISN